MTDEQYNEVHLIKLKLLNKNNDRVTLRCPFLDQFTPKVELKNKLTLYVPLINQILVSKDAIENSNAQQISINVQLLLDYPFDKHEIKVQTYEDEEMTLKGQVINIQLQFSLFLTVKEQKNFINVFFKQANLKKDLKVFGKMSPHIVVVSEQAKLKSRQIKNGHLNPRFQQQMLIPFKSVFDKLIIEVKQGQQLIGYNDMFIFELFGKNEDRQLQLIKEHKMVGNLTYVVEEFQPEDF